MRRRGPESERDAALLDPRQRAARDGAIEIGQHAHATSCNRQFLRSRGRFILTEPLARLGPDKRECRVGDGRWQGAQMSGFNSQSGSSARPLYSSREMDLLAY
jgi:hypothetical protein